MIISKKVQEALEKGFPVVALETTIISHGMSVQYKLKM